MHYAAAKQLAAKGRNGDSMLLHVGPEEMRGIASLGQMIGRPLTVNPSTGLPEAFRLKDLGILIPLVGGIGGGMLGGPLGAAAGAAAGEAINSGLIQKDEGWNILGNSLGAGVLGGIGGAMAGAGAPVAEAATQAGTQAATQAATQAGTQAATQAGTQAATQAGTQAAAQAAANTAAQGMFSGLMGSPIMQQLATSVGIPGALALLDSKPNYDTESDLYDSLNQDYEIGARQMRGMGYNIPAYGAPGYAGGGAMGNPMPPDYYPQAMIATAQPKPGATPIPYDPMTSQQYGAPVGQGYASGGMTPHGSEGMLRGPGDGQSDGIAAVIHGKQGTEPVRLADSEYVVPADVVAALGAGSSSAGAKAMDAMLARVRKQAYGHTQQMRPVDHKKVMPA